MHRPNCSTSPIPTVIFASNWSIPTKSSLSPPSTTASTDSFSLSPSLFSPRTPFSPSSPGNASCAYPSWPNRASLSPSIADSNRYECADSRISDDDLISLDGWLLRDERGLREQGLDMQEQEISWSRTVQPPFGGSVVRREPRRLAPPPVERRRRRSSPLKRRAGAGAMNTIAE